MPIDPDPDDAIGRGSLVATVYGELHRIAKQRMRGERSDHTLQATALVHEVFVRLTENRGAPWKGKAQFFVAAAEAMRRVLIDHARRRGADKRGGARQRVPLNVADLAHVEDPAQVLALDEAILRLEQEEPRAAAVVRMRFYAGLGVDETAEVLGQSRRTVLRDWEYARAWLHAALDPSP
jgi:RNA polymerase sigma-70 factor (ECF subfamily)